MGVVLVGEPDRIVGVGRDDAAQFRDPVDLLLSGVGEVHDHRAVVGARIGGHALVDGVEHQVEPRVAVDVDVQLPAGLPVHRGERPEHLRLHQPFTVVAWIGLAGIVEVGVAHLHQLADNRAVGEQLDLLGQQPHLASGSPGDLRLGVGHRLGGVHPGVGLAARVHEKR